MHELSSMKHRFTWPTICVVSFASILMVIITLLVKYFFTYFQISKLDKPDFIRFLLVRGDPSLKDHQNLTPYQHVKLFGKLRIFPSIVICINWMYCILLRLRAATDDENKSECLQIISNLIFNVYTLWIVFKMKTFGFYFLENAEYWFEKAYQIENNST